MLRFIKRAQHSFGKYIFAVLFVMLCTDAIAAVSWKITPPDFKANDFYIGFSNNTKDWIAIQRYKDGKWSNYRQRWNDSSHSFKFEDMSNGTYTFRIRQCDQYSGSSLGNCTNTASKSVTVDAYWGPDGRYVKDVSYWGTVFYDDHENLYSVKHYNEDRLKPVIAKAKNLFSAIKQGESEAKASFKDELIKEFKKNDLKLDGYDLNIEPVEDKLSLSLVEKNGYVVATLGKLNINGWADGKRKMGVVTLFDAFASFEVKNVSAEGRYNPADGNISLAFPDVDVDLHLDVDTIFDEIFPPLQILVDIIVGLGSEIIESKLNYELRNYDFGSKTIMGLDQIPSDVYIINGVDYGDKLKDSLQNFVKGTNVSLEVSRSKYTYSAYYDDVNRYDVWNTFMKHKVKLTLSDEISFEVESAPITGKEPMQITPGGYQPISAQDKPDTNNNATYYNVTESPTKPVYIPSCSVINIGMTCSEGWCNEAFGRSCYSAGGVTKWENNQYVCKSC